MSAEGNEVARRIIAQTFDDTSHAFVDPRQGLNWCLANNPDLVIVDYDDEILNRDAYRPVNAEVPAPYTVESSVETR